MSNKAKQKNLSSKAKLVLAVTLFILLLGIAALVLYETGIMGKWFGWDSNNTLTVSETVVSLDADAEVMVGMARDLLLRSNAKGLRATKSNGETAWDLTFNMSAPHLVTNGEWSAVGDLEGQVVVVASSKGEAYRLTTENAIQMLSVNSIGNLVLVLNDQDENYVNVYSAEGKLLISRHTFQDKDGVVLQAVVNEDCTRLVTSYYKYTGLKTGSVLTVFDLTSKGTGLVDNIVGSLTIEDELVTDLFFSSDRAFFVSESSVGALTIQSEVSIAWKQETGRKLEAVAFGGKVLALIYADERIGLQAEGKAGLRLYNINGTLLFSEEGAGYTSLIGGNSSFIYGDGYSFKAIDERGVRLWQADLAVKCDALYAFSDEKTVAGQTKNILQFYSVGRK